MNGTLPEWIQRMLDIESGPGEGVAWRLLHTWSSPPWVTLLLVLFIVLFVVGIYLREGRRAGLALKLALATVRVTLIAIVLLMIAQLMLGVQRTGLPYLAVVIDDTASMAIVDRYEARQTEDLADELKAAGLDPGRLSRENLAKMLLLRKNARWLREWSRDYNLRVYFVTSPREVPADGEQLLIKAVRNRSADGTSSPLGATLRQVLDDLRGTTPAGIVLLSDGINTEGPALSEAAVVARRRGAPLFIVGLGDDRPVADLKLTDLLVDDVVFVDDVVQFEATLVASGYTGRELRVTLRQEGRPEVLAESHVTADPAGLPQTVRLTYRPTRQGRFRYVVEIEPVEGELQTDNNRLARDVDVRKEQIRVLLVQAYPNFEFRYLKQMLARERSIRLHTLLQDADVAHAGQDAGALTVFPVRREELFEYDVVIIGDVDFKRLGAPAMENLAAFTQQPTGNSGSLVFIAGPEFTPVALRDTPLEPLLPVVLASVRLPRADAALTEGFVVEPTPLGLESPPMQLGREPSQTKAIWESLPPLYWMIDVSELKPGVRVFAVNPRQVGHDGKPLPVICMQYVGSGKVLMHMTDETWRWRRGAGDRYFARYWVQMIRFLARAKLIDDGREALLTTDRRQYRQGETVHFRLRFAGPPGGAAARKDVVLVVEQEGRRTRRVPLSRHPIHDAFEGSLTGAGVGKYHAWLASPATEGAPPTVDFSVSPPAGEFERIRTETALMRRAAEATRGRYYSIDDAHRLRHDLPPGHHAPIETLPPVPLWNRWPLVALFLGLLVTEWIVRKMKGMV